MPSRVLFWPRDLLANDFQNVRILTFGYASDPTGSVSPFGVLLSTFFFSDELHHHEVTTVRLETGSKPIYESAVELLKHTFPSMLCPPSNFVSAKFPDSISILITKKSTADNGFSYR